MKVKRLLTYLECLIISGILIFFLFIGITADAGFESKTFTDPQGWTINREFIPHSKDSNKKFELFWTKPTSEGTYPAILFIHGHQENVRNGGEFLVNVGRLGRMANLGYVAAAISQPGYGNSDGPPDYCGPFTQDAVLDAIDFLRTRPFVKQDKIALFGYSRGAIVASMVATKDQKLGAVILAAGAYDFPKWFPTNNPGINANIRKEAGTSSSAFTDRSALYHAEKITSPVLLLHGAQDDRIPARQAKKFAEKLNAQGNSIKIVVLPRTGHSIPVDMIDREMFPFLEEFLQ
jgi:dipeptidyl aminopeptidase/acylaminoacyl peptidase